MARTHIYDLASEDGPKLLEVEEVVARELLERFGDRYTRSPPDRLVIYDLEFPDGHGASAIQMHAADAWHAHRSNPERWVWELPRGVHPHSDRMGKNRLLLA